MSVYLDYNATAPLRPEAADAMREVFDAGVGNPSSMHGNGRRARHFLETARDTVAGLLGARRDEVVFTSGATEANNLAIRGAFERAPDCRFITSAMEHASVLAPLAAIEQGGADVVRLRVSGSGQVDPASLAESTREYPALVTLAPANGETGHVADLAAVSQALGEAALLHLDAAHAIGRIEVSLGSGVDLLSMSAHKFGGPAGVGALVVGRAGRDALSPILRGGPQELGLRGGTPNVAGIAGMAAAMTRAVEDRESESRRLRTLRDALWSRLSTAVPDLLRLTPADGLTNTLTLAAPGIGSDSLVAGLDLAGFSVSAGSACAAASPEPSHVVTALGVEERYQRGVLRISLGHGSSADHTDAFARALLELLERSQRAA